MRKKYVRVGFTAASTTVPTAEETAEQAALLQHGHEVGLLLGREGGQELVQFDGEVLEERAAKGGLLLPQLGDALAVQQRTQILVPLSARTVFAPRLSPLAGLAFHERSRTPPPAGVTR